LDGEDIFPFAPLWLEKVLRLEGDTIRDTLGRDVLVSRLLNLANVLSNKVLQLWISISQFN